MQMIAEIYGVLRDGLGMAPKAIGEVFAAWNKGRLNSYLIEITAEVLAADDPQTGKPVVEIILDRAGQKGTGRWSVIEAQTLGIPATAIEAAVAARALSSMKGERLAAEKAYGGTDRINVSARRACAAISSWRCSPARSPPMRKASPSWTARRRNSAGACRSPTIAKIWRAGCIIRSQFLGTIAAAFGGAATAPNLLMVAGLHGHDEGSAPGAAPRRSPRCRGWAADAGAVIGAGLFRRATARGAAPRTSSRRSAISSARTVSSGSMPTAPITVPGAAAPPDPASTVAQAARQASGARQCCLLFGRDHPVRHAEALERARIFAVDPRQHRTRQFAPGQAHVLVDDMHLPAGTGAAAATIVSRRRRHPCRARDRHPRCLRRPRRSAAPAPLTIPSGRFGRRMSCGGPLPDLVDRIGRCLTA